MIAFDRSALERGTNGYALSLSEGYALSLSKGRVPAGFD
jgi:hypothetical protein